MFLCILQKLPHFGPYRKQREHQLHKLHLNTDPLFAEQKTTNGDTHNNGVNKYEIPKINDVIGLALPKIGAYKQLDNTKQVVALIDDVRILSCLLCI